MTLTLPTWSLSISMRFAVLVNFDPGPDDSQVRDVEGRDGCFSGSGPDFHHSLGSHRRLHLPEYRPGLSQQQLRRSRIAINL